MRKLLLMMFLMALIPTIGIAQRAEGYGFIAPGRIYDETTVHFGAGGGGPIYKGLGAGLELGYLSPAKRLGDGFGIFSANGSYHFLRESASGKVVPFATGGYSLAFSSGSANGFNFGGGVNYWFADRAGLRFEVRDHVFERSHFYGFRVGFAWRGSGRPSRLQQ